MKTLLKVVINMLDQSCEAKAPRGSAEIMLICHCERVNDRKIRQAVENGARTVGQVGRICGAGTCCGGCVRAIAEIVEEGDAPRSELHHLPARRQPLPIAAE